MSSPRVRGSHLSGPTPAVATAVLPGTAEQILSQAQSGRTVIQDFCPLAESLEWQLGQDYLRDRGNKAFISDASPVPFVVNNDGTLSYNAAEVFFASLRDAEEQGTLTADEDIYVLELGIGVGLFARFFLDAVQELCGKENKDYYDRLCYIAADRSPRMLLDLLRHGVLADHPGRYRVRQVDALQPEAWLPRDVLFHEHPGKPLRAVFLNYLLDCLPAAVLDLSGEAVKQLHVRTCVARNVRLAEHTDLKPEQLVERAKSLDAVARQELLEVYGLFASEYDYRPVESKTLPLGEFALSFAQGKTSRLVHSYGAIQSLEKLLALVKDEGFILMNDYGSDRIAQDHDFEHQRFSLATFVGVNFAELKAYFDRPAKPCWAEPTTQTGSIHSRLLGQQLSWNTRRSFGERFGKVWHDQLHEPTVKARQWQQVGRFELAASDYQAALQRQPYNWVLLSEIASFLIFALRDLKAGIDMAKLALQLNPTCSAELWNTLGDGLFEFGRLAEARSAYHQALSVNDSDVRARYNLAWVYTREKNYPAALERIAQALTLDKLGQYRDRLLAKQQEVVALQAARHQQEYLLLINLVSKYQPAASPDQGRSTVEKQEDTPATQP